MTDTDKELLPCPFCGGAASLGLCGFGTARVVCMACGSEGSDSPTREKAIAAWNRRTPATRRAIVRAAATIAKESP